MTSQGTATLLMQLAGPMQSWGTRSRFDQRDTEREPTKSGVLGMVCAALGKPRDDKPGPWPSLASLASLRMGVRVLAEGRLCEDFQTTGGGEFPGLKKFGVWRASGSVGSTVVSARHFLADAAFVVGLEGPLDLLGSIQEALKSPVWPLSLGRKSYVPSVPVHLPCRPSDPSPIRPLPLEEALASFECQSSQGTRQRLVIEVPLEGATETRMDVPLSFLHRTFAARGVQTTWLEL